MIFRSRFNWLFPRHILPDFVCFHPESIYFFLGYRISFLEEFLWSFHYLLTSAMIESVNIYINWLILICFVHIKLTIPRLSTFNHILFNWLVCFIRIMELASSIHVLIIADLVINTADIVFVSCFAWCWFLGFWTFSKAFNAF